MSIIVDQMARNMFNLAPMLEKENLFPNGRNYADWFLRFVLENAKEYVMDQPRDDAPAKDAPPEEVIVYAARNDDYDSVQRLMLTCMDPELHKHFEGSTTQFIIGSLEVL